MHSSKKYCTLPTGPEEESEDSIYSIIEPIKWPIECEYKKCKNSFYNKILDRKIRHIYYNPPKPEPFYVPTGKELQQKPAGAKTGTIVFEYNPTSETNVFTRSCVGGSPLKPPTYAFPAKDSLKFESRFESGNLAKAIRIADTHYELYLRNDLYTKSHMQWYYFRVTNMKKNVTYRFSIVNLKNENSLYKQGMKPLLYSTKDAIRYDIGWKRCGDNITYFCNKNAKSNNPEELITYTLTFTLEFPHSEDKVYLAYSYPYTYSDLQEYLLEISKNPVKSKYTTIRLLCRTLADNNVYYLTVTAPEMPNQQKVKRAVIITARVHPSESPSSWMMKGVIDFLVGDSKPARRLRENFIFTIVPMLNPDGVIVGNTRCSLSGADLNRKYRTAVSYTHPTIWYTKLIITRLLEEYDVAMYCDLHAHSTKHNIFMYGCEYRTGPAAERRFPLLLYKNSADKFSFESCKFNVNINKETTGRVVIWRMGIDNSYTMEASFGGSLLGTRAATHFTVKDYEVMGCMFCKTLLEYCENNISKLCQTALGYDSNIQMEESELNVRDIERISSQSCSSNKNISVMAGESETDVEDLENVRHMFYNIYKNLEKSKSILADLKYIDSSKNIMSTMEKSEVAVKNSSHVGLGQNPENICDVQEGEDNVKFFQDFSQNCRSVYKEASPEIIESELDVKNSMQIGQSSSNIYYPEESESNVKFVQKLNQICRKFATEIEESDSVVKHSTDVRKMCKNMCDNFEEYELHVKVLRKVRQRSRKISENVSTQVEESEIDNSSQLPRNIDNEVSAELKESQTVVNNYEIVNYDTFSAQVEESEIENSSQTPRNIDNKVSAELKESQTVVNNSEQVNYENISAQVEESEIENSNQIPRNIDNEVSAELKERQTVVNNSEKVSYGNILAQVEESEIENSSQTPRNNDNEVPLELKESQTNILVQVKETEIENLSQIPRHIDNEVSAELRESQTVVNNSEKVNYGNISAHVKESEIENSSQIPRNIDNEVSAELRESQTVVNNSEQVCYGNISAHVKESEIKAEDSANISRCSKNCQNDNSAHVNKYRRYPIAFVIVLYIIAISMCLVCMYIISCVYSCDSCTCFKILK